MKPCVNQIQQFVTDDIGWSQQQDNMKLTLTRAVSRLRDRGPKRYASSMSSRYPLDEDMMVPIFSPSSQSHFKEGWWGVRVGSVHREGLHSELFGQITVNES